MTGDSGTRCWYDWVTVKQTWNDETVLVKRCGRRTPPVVNARGSTLITFRTDGSVQKRGFSARFTVSN